MKALSVNALIFRTLSVTLVAGALFAAPLPAAARDDVVPGASSLTAAAVSNATELVATKSSSGSTATSLAIDGFTPLDTPRTVNCPLTSGLCRIEIDQNVVVAGGSTSTVFGICTKVDGVLITPCINLGFAPPIRQTKNYVQFQSVAGGNHSAQTFVYTNRGAVAAAFAITYHIYK